MGAASIRLPNQYQHVIFATDIPVLNKPDVTISPVPVSRNGQLRIELRERCCKAVTVKLFGINGVRSFPHYPPNGNELFLI